MSGRLNGRLIREYLEETFQTRVEIAVKLGISGSLMDQMLAGRVPKAVTVKALAKLMGVQETDLVIPEKAKTA